MIHSGDSALQLNKSEKANKKIGKITYKYFSVVLEELPRTFISS